MSSPRTLHLDGEPGATLAPFGIHRIDPTHRSGRGLFARAVLTPAGPGTLELRWSGDGGVTAEGWGDGADWLLEAAPRWLGRDDDARSFDPTPNRKMVAMWRDHGPVRLGSSGVVWQELLFAIIGQRVTTVDAARNWRAMVRAWGEPAPGPHGLVLPPTPEAIASRSYTEFHRFDIERSRAMTMVAAARLAHRLEEAATMPIDAALARLMHVNGIGPWTATSTLAATAGHPDVVIERDYGLPTYVCWAFTGDARRQTDDERMFELLEPYRPHRWRVVRLLFTAGVSPPRRAPRARNPRISRL